MLEYGIGLILSCVPLSACTSAGPHSLSIRLDLKPPIRILSAGYYEDGGTLAMMAVDARGDTLWGGFDGRMQMGTGGAHPWHLFVGAPHPDLPGALLLPLWGAGERSFLDLVDRGLEGTLTKKQLRALAAAHRRDELPDNLQDLWGLSQAARDRRQTLDAIAHGDLAGPDQTHRFFEPDTPVVVMRVVELDTPSRFHVRLRGSRAKEFDFVVDTERGGAEMRVSSGQTLMFTSDGIEERLMLTLISWAIRHGGGATTERFVSALQARKRTILENDRTR